MKHPMSEWLLSKIMSILVKHDGCLIEEHPEATLTGARTVIVDSFGFRYEVSVKAIGRIQSNPEREV